FSTSVFFLCATLFRSAPSPQLLNLYDYEVEARTRISHGAWERISGGSVDEITLRWNREAWDHIRLKPRVLIDVSKIDTRVAQFGDPKSTRLRSRHQTI